MPIRHFVGQLEHGNKPKGENQRRKIKEFMAMILAIQKLTPK